MVYLFLLSLPVRIFLGLVGEVDSPPVVFTPILWCGFNLNIGFVYFYKVSFQHIGILVNIWGLCSFLKGPCFRYYLSNILLEEDPKLTEKYISCQYLREMLRFFLLLDLLGSLLSYFRVVSDVWTVQSIEGSAPFLRVPLMVLCHQKSRINCVLTASGVLGRLLTELFFTGILKEKV